MPAPADGRAGVLIECDPSIKSIIVNIDSDNHDFIIEDLDEERVVVKENMLAQLKQKLEEVRRPPPPPGRCATGADGVVCAPAAPQGESAAA